MAKSAPTKKPFVHSAKLVPLAFILFCVLYAVIYYFGKESALESFTAANDAVPSIRMYGTSSADTMQELADKYGILLSVGIGFLYLLFMLIVWIILKLVRVSKTRIGMPLVLLLGITPLFLLGLDMAFFTTGYTAIVNGIMFFVGTPLFYTSAIIAGLSVLFLILGAVKHPQGLAILFLFGGSLLLNGCVWDQALMSGACDVAGEEAYHCFQQLAVQSGDASQCEKVSAPEEFAAAGSNPPKDKCIDMVAQNTNDPETCKKIEGGFGSYTQEGCVENVAIGNNDLSVCDTLESSMNQCIQNVGEQIENDIQEKLNNPDQLTDQDLKNIQNQLNQASQYYEQMTNIGKTLHDMNMSTVANIK